MDAGAPAPLGPRAVTGVPIADPFRRRDKQRSWNDYGSTYWTHAATTSHPSEREAAGFLGDAGHGTRVLVAGATTSEVIAAAVERGAEVHVLDFADKLLDLAAARFGPDLHTHLHDVTDPAPTEEAGSFDVVAADRLINRFHRSEMPRVVANLMSFVKRGGQLRVSIRFGLYPLDRRLIQRGTELGTLGRFWDEPTATIDWAGVTTEIDDVAEDHGDIPASVVAEWSRLRGVESRIRPHDVAEIAREASGLGDAVRFGERLEMDAAPDSRILVATKGDDVR